MKFISLKKNQITYVLVTGFIGLLLVLLALFNDAYRGKEKVFNDKFFYIVRTYDDRLKRDSTWIHQLKTKEDILQFANTRIKSDLRDIFEENDIPTDFVMGMSKMPVSAQRFRNDTASNILWNDDPSNVAGLRETRMRLMDVAIGPDLYFLKVFLPSKPAFLIRSLLPLIVVLIFVLLLFFLCFRAFLSINKKQAKLAELKDDFINNMTHELKTPLFTISIATRMLSEQAAIKEHSKAISYISSIKDETERLNTLVNKVLQASSFENNGQQAEEDPVDVHQSIRATVKSLDLIAREKNASVKLSLNATEHTVMGDETHMKGVFYSLLDNAFKYSNATASITITTSNTRRNIVIEVTDNGIGMDAATQKFVFDRFFRAHTGNLHEVKGYGIGLSYVKAVVESMGGNISVESKPGKGSRFIVLLPLRENKTDG